MGGGTRAGYRDGSAGWRWYSRYPRLTSERRSSSREWGGYTASYPFRETPVFFFFRTFSRSCFSAAFDTRQFHLYHLYRRSVRARFQLLLATNPSSPRLTLVCRKNYVRLVDISSRSWLRAYLTSFLLRTRPYVCFLTALYCFRLTTRRILVAIKPFCNKFVPARANEQKPQKTHATSSIAKNV